MCQCHNAQTSQTKLGNTPAIARQDDWKHHAKQDKNQTFSVLELQNEKLHFPAELSAKEAEGFMRYEAFMRYTSMRYAVQAEVSPL